MKKISIIKMTILLLTVLFAMTYASFSQAGPPQHVSYTVHNLGSTTLGPFQADAGSSTSTFATQVCIFCHTPHNSQAGKQFLWNRLDSTATFKFYTSSDTLTPTAGAVSSLGQESKMCMSCHDGVTAMNAMGRPTSPITFGGGGSPDMSVAWPMFDEYGPNIGEGVGGIGGGNLTNDHPISFSYSAAQAEDPQLKAIANPIAEGLVFWGPTQRLECVTCHDPHVDYGFPDGTHNATEPNLHGGDRAYAPFLRRRNSSSGLCFACHNK